MIRNKKNYTRKLAHSYVNHESMEEVSATVAKLARRRNLKH